MSEGDSDTYNLRWNAASMSFNATETDMMFSAVNGLGAKLEKDGNQWCFIYGELPKPNCIVGFGNSPHEALREFYSEWIKDGTKSDTGKTNPANTKK